MKMFFGSIALLLAICGPASASMINPPFNFYGAVNGSAAVGFNTLQLLEGVYDASAGWGVTFDVLPFNQPGAPVNYEVQKVVTNLTGSTWNTFGFGVGGGVSLLGGISISGSGVSGAVGSGGVNQYGWSNVSIAPGETFTVRFSMQTCANCFTPGEIGQFAGSTNSSEVPEPATLLLMGSSLVGISMLRRKFRR